MNTSPTSPSTLDKVKLCGNLHVAPNAAEFDRQEDEVLLHGCETVIG